MFFFAAARNFSFSSEVLIPVMFVSYDSSDFSLPELDTDGKHIVLIILHSLEAIGSRSFELECCRWKSREKLTAQNGGSAVNTVLKEAIQGKDVSQSSTPR
jgi:hypothetical protein